MAASTGNIKFTDTKIVEVVSGSSDQGMFIAGSIIGDSFLSMDFSLATLSPELEWDVEIVGSQILLNVLHFCLLEYAFLTKTLSEHWT